jgi:uncharacterized protein YkwD
MAVLRRCRLSLLLVAGLISMAVFSGCTAESSAELKTYDGINAMRQAAGLPPLKPDPALLGVARARSADMAALGYFSHDPPDGCNYVCLLNQGGVPYSYAGENIAWNNYNWAQTADVAVNMWRNSPPHYANITNCHYERFATGVKKAADGKVYYTMIFEGNRAC